MKTIIELLWDDLFLSGEGSLGDGDIPESLEESGQTCLELSCDTGGTGSGPCSPAVGAIGFIVKQCP